MEGNCTRNLFRPPMNNNQKQKKAMSDKTFAFSFAGLLVRVELSWSCFVCVFVRREGGGGTQIVQQASKFACPLSAFPSIPLFLPLPPSPSVSAPPPPPPPTQFRPSSDSYSPITFLFSTLRQFISRPFISEISKTLSDYEIGGRSGRLIR